MSYSSQIPRMSAQPKSRWRGFFAPMPIAWLEGSPTFLADLWQRGGKGAISLLPLMTRWAQNDGRDFVISREKVAELCGCDPTTIDRARQLFEELGLGTTTLTSRGTRFVLKWHPTDRLRVPRRDDRFDAEVFFFPMRIVESGQWARLSGAQRGVYLALGLHARNRTRESRIDGQLERYLGEDHGIEASEGIRVAFDITMTRLAHDTGLNAKTVSECIQAWSREMQGPRSDGPYSLVEPHPDVYGGYVFVLNKSGLIRPWPDDSPAEVTQSDDDDDEFFEATPPAGTARPSTFRDVARRVCSRSTRDSYEEA